MAKVLLVDSYDSYTYNLYQLILNVVPDAEVIIVRNDQCRVDDLHNLVVSFDFIVIGPGPGDPRNAKDIGFLLSLFDHSVPILGVCLGFQLLCLRMGARIGRLQTVKHGQVSSLRTIQGDIYSSGESFKVTRYHSLYADIAGVPSLKELAWVDDHGENGHVTMTVQHTSQPFVGVQYHPESACSEHGTELISNFVKLAADWNHSHRPLRSALSHEVRKLSIRPKALAPVSEPHGQVEWLELPYLLPTESIAELLHVRQDSDFVLLDAAAEPSRFSIMASLSGDEEHLQYATGQSSWQFGSERIESSATCPTIWHYMAGLMEDRKVLDGPRETPFWGGFIGYLSYESGVETLQVASVDAAGMQSDVNLVFVDRSIVLDHIRRKIYIQSIRAMTRLDTTSDRAWLIEMRQMLERAHCTPPPSPPSATIARAVSVSLPDKLDYIRKIETAQTYLSEGQSYELCLTAQTKIICDRRKPWDLYRDLRKRNPSPFAAYLRLGDTHLLSSSPERFLSWDRTGACQLRPIKGTVRKSPGVGHAEAVDILQDPKEIAENLMIVDLIRNDLHQIAKDVQVPLLMQVEEYHTVFQLVSVITGRSQLPYTGLDVLSRSLPPGSMTGAPKKRSVELLQKLEQSPRGLYSGVCGYLSVCGGGDWSVIIRSAFRYESENLSSSSSDVWRIGAGGAITALSDPEAEWQEMLTKLQSTLPCFGLSTVQQ